jgi:hypothetical protein
MKPRPVLIEWRDSTYWEPGRWVDLDELDGSACDVITVGLADRPNENGSCDLFFDHRGWRWYWCVRDPECLHRPM